MNYDQIELTIKNMLAANIPALLATAGLAAIDEFVQGKPLYATDNELCVYLADGNNDGEREYAQFIIQLQLNNVTRLTPHNDVIWEFILNGITADSLGFSERNYANFDIWPMESTGFVYYELQFYNRIDDCY